MTKTISYDAGPGSVHQAGGVTLLSGESIDVEDEVAAEVAAADVAGVTIEEAGLGRRTGAPDPGEGRPRTPAHEGARP